MVIERCNDREIKVRAGSEASTKSECGQRGIAMDRWADAATASRRKVPLRNYMNLEVRNLEIKVLAANAVCEKAFRNKSNLALHPWRCFAVFT